MVVMCDNSQDTGKKITSRLSTILTLTVETERQNRADFALQSCRTYTAEGICCWNERVAVSVRTCDAIT